MTKEDLKNLSKDEVSEMFCKYYNGIDGMITRSRGALSARDLISNGINLSREVLSKIDINKKETVVVNFHYDEKYL